MLKKTKKTTQPPRKGKKGSKSITTTSVAFKTKNIEDLKKHDLFVKEDQSVSWILNRLVEKLVSGEISVR